MTLNKLTLSVSLFLKDINATINDTLNLPHFWSGFPVCIVLLFVPLSWLSHLDSHLGSHLFARLHTINFFARLHTTNLFARLHMAKNRSWCGFSFIYQFRTPNVARGTQRIAEAQNVYTW